tara:strand:- start:4165 stop:5130 length:966 start_codon:yes stop_codon:yes gene_type:complete
MKSYNKFVSESYSARENIQEALPALALLPAAGKALSYGLAAYQAYQAAQKLRKGDYKGAAFDAALAIPSAGVAGRVGQTLKWGQRGKNIATNTLRGAKAAAITADALREPTEAGDDTKPTTPAGETVADKAPAAKPSSVVLARKGGVMGKLDKATGKWTKGDWTQKETDRYKKVSAALGKNPNLKQSPAPAAPKPAPAASKPAETKPAPVATVSAAAGVAKKNLPSGVATGAAGVAKKNLPSGVATGVAKSNDGASSREKELKLGKQLGGAAEVAAQQRYARDNSLIGQSRKNKLNPDSSIKPVRRSAAETEKIKKGLQLY